MEFIPYQQLPVFETTGEHHNWGFFGNEDHVGTLNFITRESIGQAAKLVLTGRTVCLSLPLNLPQPPLAHGRKPFSHDVEVTRSGRDDKVDNFYLQCSSQWDGLAHIRYREFGYYGGRQDPQVEAGELGIDWIARRGIIARGVLVDFARFYWDQGIPLDATTRVPLGPEAIEEVLEWSGSEVHPGDVLLFRTGWLEWYLALENDERDRLAGALTNTDGGIECPGLAPGVETAEWLWNRRVAAVAADNPALESLRVRPSEGFLHRRILALLGMPVGEFWFLEELSRVCRDTSRYEFFLTSAPLNLVGGVGSPNNAYAIF